MEALDSIASRYGVKPSEVIGEPDGFKALSINLWAHNWGVQRENVERKLSEGKHGG